ADRRRCDRRRVGEGNAGQSAGWPPWVARRRRGVLRDAPEDRAALCGAEYRGRRLGRAPQRRRRVGHPIGVPGARSQWVDRRDRVEVPGAGREPRATAGFLRCRTVSWWAWDRHARTQSRRWPLELRTDQARPMPILGALGRQRRRTGWLSVEAAGG